MRKIVSVLTVCVLCFGCAKEEDLSNTSVNQSAVYSDSDKVNFKDILFTLSPYTMVDGVKSYLVAPSIKAIAIRVNNQSWGTYHSFGIDTTTISSKISDSFRVTDKQLKYAVIANLQPPKDTLTTAGEYADLLNNSFSLAPGSYILQIESFDIQFGTATKRVYPFITVPLEVKENTISQYIGGFEIEVTK